MKVMIRILLCCLLLALGVGCIGWSSSAADRREPPDGGPSFGSIQIYSGRVLPAWQLTDMVRLELVQAMAVLQAVPDDRHAPPDQLGFRSVDVSNLDTAQGWASLVRLEEGLIVIELVDGASFALQDPYSTGLRTVLPEIETEVDPTVGQLIEDALAS